MAGRCLSWIFIIFLYSQVTLITGDPIDGALAGYDPMMANPIQSPDPGVKDQIFELLKGTSGTGDASKKFFIGETRVKLNCESKLKEKTYHDYNQYKQGKFSSHTFSSGAEVAAKGGDLKFSFETNFGVGVKSTREETNIVNFFQENEGEIIEKNFECITHAVNISPFVRPVFTRSFIEALREINNAAKTPKSQISKDAFHEFVRKYGTHYMRSTLLGAKHVYRKLFTSTSVNASSENKRTECVANSAYGSFTRNHDEVSSAPASFLQRSLECDDSSSSDAYFSKHDMNPASVISIGSLPTYRKINEWSSKVTQSPVPIYFKLEKISKLFRRKWFKEISISDDESEKLNGNAMYEFVERRISEDTVCGINNPCEPGRTCRLGYRCSKIYGEVIIAGGLDTDHNVLSEVEVFGAGRRLRNLPHAAAAADLTLSHVGNKIFACGGRNGGPYNADRLNSCYSLDIATAGDRQLWMRLASAIPTGMSGHTASVIGSHIRLVYNNTLYDLNTTATPETFKTYALNIKVTAGMCAVSNDTHSYIIGAGSNYDQIWVNSEAHNPAKWHQVATMSRGRVFHACLWLDDTVFITGGWEFTFRGISSRTDVEVFDPDTGRIRETGPLIDARVYHAMMVLDGRPAVAGGETAVAGGGSGSASRAMDSIETYNVATGQWTKDKKTLKKERHAFGLVQLWE